MLFSSLPEHLGAKCGVCAHAGGMHDESCPSRSTAQGSPPAPRRVTERDMLDLLGQRYTFDAGNGPRYAYAEHVKSAAGHDAPAGSSTTAPRVADFIAMDLWPAQGLHLHGHEVKVSRADWLTELRDPDKAEAFKPYMDRWWLVVSDAAIVKPGELPEGWGLIAPGASGKLRVRVPAPVLDPLPLPRPMLACLLRATAKTARR